MSSSWADDDEDDTPFEEINFDNSQDGVHFFFKKVFFG